jgi:LCP family protein required for cell wall assembly
MRPYTRAMRTPKSDDRRRADAVDSDNHALAPETLEVEAEGSAMHPSAEGGAPATADTAGTADTVTVGSPHDWESSGDGALAYAPTDRRRQGRASGLVGEVLELTGLSEQAEATDQFRGASDDGPGEPALMGAQDDPAVGLPPASGITEDVTQTEPVASQTEPQETGKRHVRIRKRWWLKAVALAVGAATIGAVAVAGFGYYMASSTVRKIPTADLQPGTLAPAVVGKPQNFLVLGSDSREGENADIGAGSPKEVGGRRSDTIMLLQLDPRKRRGVVLSIPRDTRVEIPGHGFDKINAAYAYGGADLAVRTVANFTGLEIHHYVEIDFAGFISVVDALGGVEICIDAPIRDEKTGLYLDKAGCHRLSGEYALAYTRSRTPEIKENGRWVPDTSGDFGRIQRQQQFLKALARQAISVNAVARWRELAKAVSAGVKVDNGVDVESFLELYRQFGDMSPDRVEMLSLPGEAKTIGGVSYVVPKQPEAANLFYSLGASRPDAPEGGADIPRVVQVRVKIVDGSRDPDGTKRLARRLEQDGFFVTGILRKKSASSTEILYERGGYQYASAIQAYLAGPVKLTETRKALEGDILITLGDDVQVRTEASSK